MYELYQVSDSPKTSTTGINYYSPVFILLIYLPWLDPLNMPFPYLGMN